MSKKGRLFLKILSAGIVLGLFISAWCSADDIKIMKNNRLLKKAVVAIAAKEVFLNEIVPFEWDCVYSFAPYAPKEEMERVIGLRSKHIKETVSEGMVQLIFIKDDEVVCSICRYSDNLGYRISFYDGAGSYSKLCFEQNAVFRVEKEKDGVVGLYYKE